MRRPFTSGCCIGPCMESRFETRLETVSVPLEARLHVRPAVAGEVPGRVALLLHGYEQDGEGLLKRCADAVPADVLAVAPDGLFPLPRKVERRYRVGFSWYFYDPYEDAYFVDPAPAVAFLRGVLERINPGRLPVTLVGFSQGGYLAPFLAQELPWVDQIIGMGCQFLEGEIDFRALAARGCRMDAIHGARDEVVDPYVAMKSHQALMVAGVPGEFTLLEGTGHKIDEAMRARLAELLLREPQENS